MTTPSRFRCPRCDFAIFNRSVAQCESCGASLPPELLLSSEQRSFLEADRKKTEKMRESLARKAAEAREQRAKKWRS